MRSSLRYDKKQYRRGLFSGSRQQRLAKVRCKYVSAALLLLFAIPWLTTRPAVAPTHESRANNSLKTEVLGDKISEKAPRDREENDTILEKSAPNMGNANRTPWKIRQFRVADDDVCDRSQYPAKENLLSDQLTILVNGYAESRLPLLQTQVQLYSALPFVHSIYILWGNTSTSPEILEKWSFRSFGAEIFIVRQDSPSLNDRFLPRNYIETGAVMICDDDITVEPSSLKFAFNVWKEHEGQSIVGFFPRAHLYDFESKSWMYVKEQHKYSIMLTKLMILATEFLYLYTCDMPTGVKEYVDEVMNCEDIAMNFLVSSRSRKGPILVEGKARDWGDPRNSGSAEADDELVLRISGALSGRKNHRKHRGDCITEFQKLWNGMELRYSHSKASANLENEVQCEKFGYLVDCDASAVSRRDVQRMVGENVIAVANRFAYVTFVSSELYMNASLLLVHSLRTTGTIHDLVVLLGPSCSPIGKDHVLYDHYDEVVTVDASQHGKLSVWLQLQYAKLVYLEVHSLVLANLDHLFQLPEPAAAPSLFSPGEFSTGLLVIKPSNETYIRLVELLERIRVVFNRTSRPMRRHYLLNSYFNGWYLMPAENRLPARYNVPVEFSKRTKVPSWFDPNYAYESFGPLMVVRFGHMRASLERNLSNDLPSNNWSSARIKLFQSLLKNGLRPLDSDTNSDWAPSTRNSSQQAVDCMWPPKPQLSLQALQTFTSESSESREAFVTVLYGDEISKISLAAWAESFHHHHSFQSRPKTLLIVLSTLSDDYYREYRTHFDYVRAVEPIIVNGRTFPRSFTLLHLWNQTDFDKLVYVSATSFFVQNCNSLLDYTPFAALPSLFPPDTFSTNVMCIQPNQQVYDSLREKLLSHESHSQSVDRFLNAFYNDWYQKSIMHRINPTYRLSMAVEAHVQPVALPKKVVTFDLDWLPNEDANATRFWTKSVCRLQSLYLPKAVIAECGTKGMEVFSR